MLDSKDNPVLAIDGGGTCCRMALWAGCLRGMATTGPANVYSDFNGAIAQLQKGSSDLAAKLGIAEKQLFDYPAYFGLAGLISSDIESRLAQALPYSNARFGDDRLSALCGALGAQDGLIAHCGTGSFFGSQEGGKRRLIGGWGYVLGDESSAQWVGRKALGATLQVLDGIEPHGPLSEAILSRFQSAAGILDFAKEADPEAFGKLAIHVTVCASSGDVQARHILQTGAEHISDMLDKLGWSPGREICLTGGIGPFYRPYLPAAKLAAIADPIGTPLDGAILLAQEMSRKFANEHF